MADADHRHAFLAALYPDDVDGLIELRALPSRFRTFIARPSDPDLAAFLHRTQENLYFGVATRRSRENGKAENCATLPALFADLDFKTSSEAAARARLMACPLPPSAVVASGGGLHLYWLLKEPERLDEATARDAVKRWLRRLARALDADLATAEVAHVLRFPGTLNHKYDPPRPVRLEYLNADTRYNLADFDEWLPSEPAPTAAAIGGRVDGRIAAGGRNAHLTSLAGTMRRRGMSPAAIDAALVTENTARCDPPLDDAEVRAIAASVGRYAPAAAATDRPEAPLEFLTMQELAAQVAAAGRRRYLFRGVFPAVDYGALSAPPKAQKTWTAIDAAVSAASATPFLGHIPVETPGPVLIFSGEGSKGNILRRIRAVAAARGLHADDLPIVVCTRAPHLNDPRHLDAMATQIAAMRPVLVVLDPLYLAARGANSADLLAMGAMLEDVQRVCQGHEAALLVVHHHNRKEGTGASRMSGAGPAEWGRVLLSLDVKSRLTDPVTKQTTVITELHAIGGEIPDQVFRIVRRVRAVDPDDLDSALTVQTDVKTSDPAETDTPGAVRAGRLAPAAEKLLEALATLARPATQRELVDAIAAKHGHGLKRETASRQLNDLERRDLARSVDAGPFNEKLWTRIDPSCDPRDVTRDRHTDSARVTGVTFPIKVTRSRSREDDHTEDTPLGDHTTEAPRVRA